MGVFSGAYGDDTSYEITVTRDATWPVQSTIAIPLHLDAEAAHGASVYIACTENELGDTTGSLVAPTVLKNNSVGFALAANPVATAQNSVVNNFDDTYTAQDNAREDTYLFAPLPASALIARSVEPGADTFVAYLSAKVSPSLAYGKYHVAIDFEVRENIQVTFDGNGGGGGRDDIVEKGDYTFSPPELTPPVGYHFASWNSRTDGTGTTYASGDSLELTEDTVFYAIWKANTYTLRFDVNGGDSPTPDNITVTHGGAYTSLPVPTRANYRFVGWNTKADGSGTTIATGNSITITKETKVYAIWQINSDVVVIYHQNHNGTDTTIYHDTGKTFGSTYSVLSLADITLFGAPTGHHFKHWNTSPDDSATAYAPHGAINPLGYGVALYAIWEADTYTVGLDANDGDAPVPMNLTVTYGQPYGTLPMPTYTGYEFVGWFTEANGGSEITAATIVDATAHNQTLYARWAPESLRFSIQTTAANETFLVPTSGFGPQAAATGASWDWDIDWGDGSATEYTTGTSTPDSATTTSPGIAHSYAASGTWTITIRSHDSSIPYGWARAFGFASAAPVDPDTSAEAANKAKVVTVVRMPVKGFLQSATATGDHYLRNVWYGCTNLVSAAAPGASSLQISSVGDSFLRSTWGVCSSLTGAVAPDTSAWPVARIESNFLASTWKDCSSLTTAVVPDTQNWPLSSAPNGNFLYSTWEGCAALKNISNLHLSDKLTNSYSTVTNWKRTFYLPEVDQETFGDQPTFYNGNLISAGSLSGTATRETFTNRTGMNGYDNLGVNWK